MDGGALVVVLGPQAALHLAAHALRAAAEMTPSGVPPTPISTSTPEFAEQAAMAPKTSPSLIRRMRAPLGPDLVDQLSVAGTIEDHDREIADVLPLGLGDPAQVLRRRGGDVDRADGLGPTAIFSM